MKIYYVSDYCNKGIKGHSNYDFVDVAIDYDNLLFIDPMLIEMAKDEWSHEANEIINSFFDVFYKAYRMNDKHKKEELLSHASEQNGTHLGYSQGNNGKGSTKQGLLNVFSSLDLLLQDILSIKRPEDLKIFIPHFAEDRFSDLITNILHDLLNKFTTMQMEKYGIKSNSLQSFWYWDKEILSWKNVTRPSYCVNGKELLVVPKYIVRRNYLFSTNQYFNRIIVERMREEGGYMTDGKLIPKSEILKGKRNSGNHWQYDEVVSYTKRYNDALNEYHKKLPIFYAENGHPLEDDQLDIVVYGCAIFKTA